MTISIRPARLNEAEALSDLCKRSKAHWGYDAGFMALSQASLTIRPAQISAGRVIVAETDGALSGVATVEPLGDGLADLQHLFVEPEQIEQGVGRSLFAAACNLARRQGARQLSILSDPYAEAFYKQLGARRVGEAPSDAVPDRMLPMLEFDL